MKLKGFLSGIYDSDEIGWGIMIGIVGDRRGRWILLVQCGCRWQERYHEPYNDSSCKDY